MSRIELSRKNDIAISTTSDRRKKKINPQAGKPVSICKAPDMSLVDLLCNECDIKKLTADYVIGGQTVIESVEASSDEIKIKIT